MDGGIGVAPGQRALSAISSSSKVKESEGLPLLDAVGLQAVILPVILAQVGASLLPTHQLSYMALNYMAF